MYSKSSRCLCIFSLLVVWMFSSPATAQDLTSETLKKDQLAESSTPSKASVDSQAFEAKDSETELDSSGTRLNSDAAVSAGTSSVDEAGVDVSNEPAVQNDASHVASEAEKTQKTPIQAGTVEPAPAKNNVLTPEEEAEIMAALAADAEASDTSKKSDNPIISAIQSMNPDMAIIGDFALAWFSDEKNLQSGAHDPKNIGFNLQQLEMSLAASVDHVFGFSANLVFGQAGVELEEAVVTTLGLPYGLQVRAGQFLSRVGRINNTHPHTWDFVDQVFAIGKFYGAEGNRGLGAELSWLTPLPWYLEIAGAAQMPTSNASNRSFLGNGGDVEGVQDFLYTLTAKQFFALSDEVGLFWGLSYQTAPNNTGRDTRTHIYATDLYLKYSPSSYPEMFLAFQAEAFFRQRQVPRDNLFDAVGYAQLVWQINRHWATGLRGEYGSGVENDELDPEWTDHRGRAAVQVTWYPSHFSRLRAQASIDVPKWKDDPIYALFLALEITAGTHPAHSY